MRNITKVLGSLACCLAFFSTINAQNMTWGAEQINTSKREIHKIIGYDNQGYYVTRYENPHPHVVNATFAFLVTLEKYDFTGNQLFSKEFKFTEDGKDYNFDGIFCMKNNMITIMYAPDVKTVYAMRVSPDGTIDNSHKVLIGTVDNKWKKEIMPETRYIFSLSQDKSTLLGYYHKDKEKKISVVAIGDTPNVLWSKDIMAPYEDDFTIDHVTAGKNAACFVIISKKKTKEDGVNMSLLTLDYSTAKVKKIDIDLGNNKYVADIKCQTDSSTNDFVVAGTYKTDESKEGAIGGFVWRIDHSTGQIVKNTFAFDNEFLSSIISQKKADKGRGIENLQMKDFIILNDKSIVFLAEQNTAFGGTRGGEWVGAVGPAGTPIMGQGSFSPGLSASYDYNDAIIAKINANGSLAWINKIAKRQEGYTRALSECLCSYNAFVSGNTLYILYTENKKNLDLAPEETSKDEDKLSSTPQVEGYPSKVSQVISTIDISSGEMKRNVINSMEDKDNSFYTTLSIQTEPNKIIIYKGAKKSGQFGQLTLQ